MSGFGKSASPTNRPIVYSALQVSTSQYNVPIRLFWGTCRIGSNAMDYDNFQKHQQSAKGKGGGGKGGQINDYTADVLLGLCEGEIDSIQNIWASGSTTTTTTLAALNMTLFTGTAIQTPWSYWSTNHPTKARSYALTAYLGAPNLDLGSSATIPDNAFECVRTAGFSYTHSSDGWVNPESGAISPGTDCLLSDIIPDFLTNVQYGMGWTSGDLGDISQFAAYQRAQGLFFSPDLYSQTKATEIINRWAALSNSWIYWSGTKLQFVPLGDSAITGNGVAYTPQDDVAYNLTIDDFLSDGSSPPVVVTRKDPADCYNHTSISITDRTKGYVSNPFEYKDDPLVDQYGLRDSTSVQAEDIKDPGVAKVVVQLLGKRAAYIRNTYKFRTGDRYILCLPGTILTLTEPNIGLNHTRVRVKDIEGDDSGNLNFTCEEFPGTVGTFVPALVDVAASVPKFPNSYVLPGNVNTPAVVEPDSAFTGHKQKLIIAASGGDNWGGCNVHISFDRMAYSKIGEITNAARQGVLTANLASHADPDAVNTLSVDTTQSASSASPVTHDDADQLRTLSLIASQPVLSGGAYIMPTDGELLAFGDVAATGTYTADLTYLRRGAYGSAAAAHLTGDQFTIIDVLGVEGSSVLYELPPQYIGLPIYFKLASFNLFGLSTQDLSTCVEYRYTPSGAGYGTGTAGIPAMPTGLAATADVSQISMVWDANPDSDNITSYTLYRAAGTGASFGSASAIWSGLALGYIDADVAPSTGYTYFLTADNAIGSSTPTSGADATTGISGGSATSVVSAVSSPYAIGTPPALVWYIDLNNTSGGALDAELPSTGGLSVGQRIIITDAGGNAGTNAITIKTSGGGSTIDTIVVNGGWSSCRWNGTSWMLSA